MTKGLLTELFDNTFGSVDTSSGNPHGQIDKYGFSIGLSLCGGCAWAQFSQIARSDIALAATMMFILSVLTAFITPFWLGVFFGSSGDSANSDGFATPTNHSSRILIQLLFFYLIPMVCGILINKRYPNRAKIRTLLEKVSTILLIVVMP